MGLFGKNKSGKSIDFIERLKKEKTQQSGRMFRLHMFRSVIEAALPDDLEEPEFRVTLPRKEAAFWETVVSVRGKVGGKKVEIFKRKCRYVNKDDELTAVLEQIQSVVVGLCSASMTRIMEESDDDHGGLEIVK